MKTLSVTIAVAIFSLVIGEAVACTPVRPAYPGPETIYLSTYRAIFTGKLASADRSISWGKERWIRFNEFFFPGCCEGARAGRLTFDILTKWKGKYASNQAHLLELRDPCERPLKVGATYLVFLRYEDNYVWMAREVEPGVGDVAFFKLPYVKKAPWLEE